MSDVQASHPHGSLSNSEQVSRPRVRTEEP